MKLFNLCIHRPRSSTQDTIQGRALLRNYIAKYSSSRQSQFLPNHFINFSHLNFNRLFFFIFFDRYITRQNEKDPYPKHAKEPREIKWNIENIIFLFQQIYSYIYAYVQKEQLSRSSMPTLEPQIAARTYIVWPIKQKRETQNYIHHHYLCSASSHYFPFFFNSKYLSETKRHALKQTLFNVKFTRSKKVFTFYCLVNNGYWP